MTALENAHDQIGFPLPTNAPPEWVELIPAGPAVIGQDGRRWLNDRPDAIVTDFRQRAFPLVVDWEHATEHRAPVGLDAPAAGWIDRLESRAGAIWGHVKEWTGRACAALANREYRFLSPVFAFEKSSGRIVRLLSVGLTNQPNLTMTALNHRASGAELLVSVTLEQRRICQVMEISELDWIRARQANPRARNAARIHATLTPEQQQICTLMDIVPEDYLRARTC